MHAGHTTYHHREVLESVSMHVLYVTRTHAFLAHIACYQPKFHKCMWGYVNADDYFPMMHEVVLNVKTMQCVLRESVVWWVCRVGYQQIHDIAFNCLGIRGT